LGKQPGEREGTEERQGRASVLWIKELGVSGGAGKGEGAGEEDISQEADQSGGEGRELCLEGSADKDDKYRGSFYRSEQRKEKGDDGDLTG